MFTANDESSESVVIEAAHNAGTPTSIESGHLVDDLEHGLRVTEDRLRAFESQYGMTTAEFVALYADDQIAETLDTVEWLGEQRMAECIRQKLNSLNL
jgi:hypothetical protein